MRRRTIISTDTNTIPLRKRVAQVVKQVNRRVLTRFGKKAAQFLNKQFALVVIVFFVLTLNVAVAPAVKDNRTNTLINYEPTVLAEEVLAVNPYIPILQNLNEDEVRTQVISAAVGPQTSYIPKPLITETIDHLTADRIRRGLRKEIVTHTVAQGETLSTIAAHYGLNVATIIEDNDINVKDIGKIKPGSQLVIAPERKTESLAWLEELHEAERKEREDKEKARRAQLAAKTANARVGISGAKAAAAAVTEQPTGRFSSPAGGRECYNGYHSYAVDCRGAMGAPIYASAAGVVSMTDSAGWNGGYGRHIVIDHGGGWQTLYAHLNTINVAPGDRVSAGEVIAGNGNTGRSTGPHVHLEIRRSGQRLNPCSYIGCID